MNHIKRGDAANHALPLLFFNPKKEQDKTKKNTSLLRFMTYSCPYLPYLKHKE